MNFPFFFKFGEYEEYSMSYDITTAEFLKFRDLSNSYERNSTWKENLGVDLSERDFLSTKELLHA